MASADAVDRSPAPAFSTFSTNGVLRSERRVHPASIKKLRSSSVHFISNLPDRSCRRPSRGSSSRTAPKPPQWRPAFESVWPDTPACSAGQPASTDAASSTAELAVRRYRQSPARPACDRQNSAPLTGESQARPARSGAAGPGGQRRAALPMWYRGSLSPGPIVREVRAGTGCVSGITPPEFAIQAGHGICQRHSALYNCGELVHIGDDRPKSLRWQAFNVAQHVLVLQDLLLELLALPDVLHHQLTVI